ncbi:hypothetical protein PRIP_00684 [Listeria riparia FSL S10-1204]|uniref:Uncharacterized protein n=1 Tax=Listeria riparia FSL S10-1204 TaxID=1265816 RepID=W7DH49_9LIST|nr:hypothetical protein PRIP_00684 [Listeria riparia FSL S10-1204]
MVFGKADTIICRPPVVQNNGGIDRFLLSVGMKGFEPFFEDLIVRLESGNLEFVYRSTDLGV